jgi:glucosamine--fructose-6-phosphate aminotransferase (isomerizing)
VASTKAFTGQVAVLAMLAAGLAAHRGDPALGEFLQSLAQVPNLMRRAIETEAQVAELAAHYADAPNWLFLGRGINYPVALEGALKLKEISYRHAEGMPAAEIKHGPLALVEDGMPVVVVAPDDATASKVVSNVQQVRARGARVIAITTEGDRRLEGIAHHLVEVPRIDPLLSPLVTVVPLQFLAYHAALARGLDVDRPRNLAKSVTVE